MNKRQAVETIARNLVVAAIADSIADMREDCPDLDEEDWASVVAWIDGHADGLLPSLDDYDAAYGWLAARAGQEATR